MISDPEEGGLRSQSLCTHSDVLQAGDVVLFDAFQELGLHVSFSVCGLIKLNDPDFPWCNFHVSWIFLDGG